MAFACVESKPWGDLIWGCVEGGASIACAAGAGGVGTGWRVEFSESIADRTGRAIVHSLALRLNNQLGLMA